MNQSNGNAGVRLNHNQGGNGRESLPTPALPTSGLDQRYLAGCALVQRLGTVGEISAMIGNRAEVLEINKRTQAWLRAQRVKEAAA